MKAPATVSLQLLGILVAVLVGLTIGALLFVVHRESFFQVSWFVVIALIIPTAPVHEILHAILMPGSWFAGRITFGFSPKMLGFYAFYAGVLSRSRFLLIAAGPLLVLTVVPVALMMTFGRGSPLWIEIALANGMLSAADILAILFVSYRIPSGAQIKLNGLKTYWRP